MPTSSTKQTQSSTKSPSSPQASQPNAAPLLDPNAAQMLQLQRTAGNQAVSQMIQRTTTGPVVQRTMMDASVEEDVFDAAEGKRYAELSNLALSQKQRGPMNQESRAKLEGVFAPRAAAATQEKERYAELGRVENRVQQRGPMGAKKKASLESVVGQKAEIAKTDDPSTYDPVQAHKDELADRKQKNQDRTDAKRLKRQGVRDADDKERSDKLAPWNKQVGDEFAAKKTRLRDRMKHLKETKKLDKMAAIFTKGLAAKKQKAEDDIAGDLWMSAEESVEALEKKASELEEWYKPFSRMRKRLVDLKARVAGKPALPEVTQVETELNDGLAAKSMPDSLKSLFAQVSNKLNPLEANQLKEEFDTAKALGDTEASDALEDMIDNKRIWIEQLTKTYKTSYDKVSDGEFSAEFPVRGLKGIVIHAHMTGRGTPKSGNGTHWKTKSGKKDKGGTHEVSDDVRTGLITSDWGKKAVDNWARNPENPKRK